MKELHAFDLDGTLLRVDSLRRLLVTRPTPASLYAAALRALGRIDRHAFAGRIAASSRALLEDPQRTDRFAAGLDRFLDPDVLSLARVAQDAGATVVILSASPEAYVRSFARRHGFHDGIGSHWRGDHWFHCYGIAKAAYLKERYPQDRFRWAFAIADHASDEALLQEFEQSVRYRPGSPRRTG